MPSSASPHPDNQETLGGPASNRARPSLPVYSCGVLLFAPHPGPLSVEQQGMAIHGADHSAQQWLDLTHGGVMVVTIEAANDDSPTLVPRRLMLGTSGSSFEPVAERGVAAATGNRRGRFPCRPEPSTAWPRAKPIAR